MRLGNKGFLTYSRYITIVYLLKLILPIEWNSNYLLDQESNVEQAGENLRNEQDANHEAEV